jgi:hypothetical protein
MTGVVAKYAMKKVMAKEMDKYKSKDVSGPYVSNPQPHPLPYPPPRHLLTLLQDPYYELVPHPNKPGKTKKVKKEIPAYIPAQEADVLARARKTAYRLDYALFTLFGMRFGWSSVIGLVPAIGDAADGLLALNLILKMRKVSCGLPQSVLLMMMVNLAIDFIVGLVPFIGDLADASIKCNGKNVRLLEKHLDTVYKPDALKKRDEQLPREKRPRPASVLVDFDDEMGGRQDAYDGHDDRVREPQQAYSGRRPQDEETGITGQNTYPSRKEERPSRNDTKKSRR